ncbi:hypothetical protein V2J09_006141 [Rumex salicifolius]
MDNNQPPPGTQTSATYPAQPHPPPLASGQPPYHHLLQQQQQQLQMFWSFQRQEIEQANDFKNHQLPLARIKKIMKADEDVRMISAEAPILFAKACELFILELTIRSWLHAEENKRRTLQKNDIAAAITRTDIFDFLVDIVPRDEIKDEAAGLVAGVGVGMGGMVGGMVGVGVGAVSMAPETASGVPYYYPPIGQPAATGAPAVMIGRPAVDPSGVYVQGPPPPSQTWQSLWQQSEDGGYGSGNGGGLDGQRMEKEIKENFIQPSVELIHSFDDMMVLDIGITGPFKVERCWIFKAQFRKGGSTLLKRMPALRGGSRARLIVLMHLILELTLRRVGVILNPAKVPIMLVSDDPRVDAAQLFPE